MIQRLLLLRINRDRASSDGSFSYFKNSHLEALTEHILGFNYPIGIIRPVLDFSSK